MLRLLQHACVASVLLWFCRDWLHVLFWYKHAEATHRWQISEGGVRQRELVRRNALWHLAPYGAGFLVWLAYWHLYDAEYHRNEHAMLAARVHPPPPGCHFQDHHLEQPWAWVHLSSVVDSTLGTHWTEDACAAYHDRIDPPGGIEPSHLAVAIKFVSLVPIAVADCLGQCLATFLHHQQVVYVALFAASALGALYVAFLFVGPLLIHWAAAHQQGLLKRRDDMHARLRAATSKSRQFINFEEEEEEDEKEDRFPLLLQSSAPTDGRRYQLEYNGTRDESL